MIKILGMDVDVIYADLEKIGVGCKFGQCDARIGKIWIDNTMPVQMQRGTLIHELIEFIDEHCNLSLNHVQISTVSAVLYQAMKDNDLFGA